MEKLSAEHVFTPGDFPVHTYVERSQLVLEQRLSPWLATSTLVALVSGPSKSGKTSLIRRVVGDDNLIIVSGAQIRSPEQLWDRVLDWMGVPSSSTATFADAAAKSQAIEGATNAGLPGVVGFQAKGTKTAGTTATDTLAATLGRQGLPQVVREVANSTFTILLDDFHYIPADVQAEVAQQVKDAASRGVRMCIASVPHRADQALRVLADLRGRSISVDLDYWSKEDLLRIAIVGCEKLGIVVDDTSLKLFVAEAAGSPQLMQAICSWMCVHLGVKATETPPRIAVLDEAARAAILNMTSHMTDFRSLTRALISGPKVRGQDRKQHVFEGGGGGDTYLAIMICVAQNPPTLTFSYDALVNRMRALVPHEPPAFVTSCRHMGEIAALAPGPSGPALEWDDEDQVLTIPDPYLLFYLRWSNHLRDERVRRESGA